MNIKFILLSLTLLFSIDIGKSLSVFDISPISPNTQDFTLSSHEIQNPDSLVLTLKRMAYTEPNRSFDLAERIKNEARLLNNKSLESRAFHEMAFSKTFLGDNKSAVSLANTAYQMSKDIDDRIGQIRALNTKALALYHLDKYTEAVECLHEALEIQGTTRADSTEIGVTYRRMANIHFRSGDSKAMESELVKSYNMLKNTNDETLLVGTIGSLAHAYRSQGRLSEAKEYYNRVLELAKRNNMKPHLGTTYDALRGFATNEGKHQEALSLSYKALDLMKEMGDDMTICEQLIHTSRAHLKLNNIDDAQVLADEALALSKKLNHARSQEMTYELQSEIYENQGNYAKSLEHYKLYKKYNDTVTHSRNVERYKTLEKQKEIDLQEIQLNALQTNQKRQLRERNFAFAALSILGLLGLLLVRRFNQNKTLTKELYSKNEKIESQKNELGIALEEKNILLKEIHHRVKNNLQIVSSLLNLQSKKISDQNIRESINEGKNRVQAMSLIHQNLYQSNHLTTVDMNTYINDLVIYLAKSFKINDKQIKHVTDVNDIHFDIDTAIPIGLVLNELVTNVYKHAFTEQETGLININLTQMAQNQYELCVKDNGKGIPSDFQNPSPQSLGMKLIQSLGVRQLKGKLDVLNDKGTTVKLVFKEINSKKILQN